MRLLKNTWHSLFHLHLRHSKLSGIQKSRNISSSGQVWHDFVSHFALFVEEMLTTTYSALFSPADVTLHCACLLFSLCPVCHFDCTLSESAMMSFLKCVLTACYNIYCHTFFWRHRRSGPGAAMAHELIPLQNNKRTKLCHM